MSSYTNGRGLHVDRHLSNVVLDYRPSGFIADQIFPIVDVPNQTGLVLSWSQADLWRREPSYRAPGTEAGKISISASSGGFACKNFALKMATTIEDRVNMDPVFMSKIEAGRARTIVDKLMIDMEVRVASLCLNTSNVGTSAAVGTGWVSYANANPLVDIWTQMDNIRLATGYNPTDVVFGVQAWKLFARNNNVINKAKATAVAGGALNANAEEAARLLEVERVHIGKLTYNSAGEGLAQSLQDVWRDSVLVYFRPENPSIEMPSAGYSYNWSAPGLPARMAARRFPYDDKIDSDEIQVGYYQDEVITAPALMALITNVNTLR